MDNLKKVDKPEKSVQGCVSAGLACYVIECRMKLDKFHFHEIADRSHLICSMIDDFLIEHPGMTVAMNKKCEDAQQLICEVISLASAEKDRTFGT